MNNCQGREKCKDMLGMSWGERMEFAKIYHTSQGMGKAEKYRK